MPAEKKKVSRKVVLVWNFNCLGYETNEENVVTQIYCKICREYSNLRDVKMNKKGIAKLCAENFVKGTDVVKKNNFSDHVKKSVTHAAAVTRIAEERAKEKKAQEEEGESSEVVTVTTTAAASGVPRQATMTPFIQRLNKAQHSQLVKKMQIAHFTAANAKSFSFYADMSKFCKETLQVCDCLNKKIVHPSGIICLNFSLIVIRVRFLTYLTPVSVWNYTS